MASLGPSAHIRRRTGEEGVTMLVAGQGTVVKPGEGPSVDLGVLSMRVLAGGEDSTDRRFTLAEFTGSQAGAWTVPHLHRGFEESFYVLDGRFFFTLGEEQREALPGSYVLVPRDTRHTIVADEGGGRLLTLMVPGGLEDMFFELGRMGPDALRDPAARAAVSARYDSIPTP
jgi:mannose-6-phosphate isomerase-like protein (cupin superfamily)